MRGFLVINPRAGAARPTALELRDAARERGIDAHILDRGEDAGAVARASGADVLGAAGGDGSLAPVAAVAIERDLPFVCVPFGTRNHFARDLGLERADPLAGLAAFDGVERRIDVGRVGERVFLNNTSLGIYGLLVHHRERHRRRRSALARARALALAAAHRNELAFTIDGRPLLTRAILVANNDYELDLFNVGARKHLDRGQLHLYVTHGVMPRTWEERTSDRFVIDASARRLRVAVDGEPEVLSPPVEFRIEPLALRVLVAAG